LNSDTSREYFPVAAGETTTFSVESFATVNLDEGQLYSPKVIRAGIIALHQRWTLNLDTLLLEGRLTDLYNNRILASYTAAEIQNDELRIYNPRLIVGDIFYEVTFDWIESQSTSSNPMFLPRFVREENEENEEKGGKGQETGQEKRLIYLSHQLNPINYGRLTLGNRSVPVISSSLYFSLFRLLDTPRSVDNVWWTFLFNSTL